MLWLALAGLTALAVAAVLWPFLRPARPAVEGGPDSRESAFYKAQLDEIARDVARGQLPQDEAAAARAEAARRLIAASARPADAAPSSASPRARYAVMALIILGLPAIALSLYWRIGAPNVPDAPLAERRAAGAAPGDVEAAVAGVEAHLLEKPDDGHGWAVIAPVYMRLGRFADAARAYSETMRTLGEKPALRAAYGEALVAEAGGVVTAQAREAFEKAVAEEPGQPMASFYLALGAEQEGKTAEAIAAYEKLLAASPKNAAWSAGIKDRLATLKGEPAPPAAKAPSDGVAPADAGQDAMIRSMVQRLATRLSAEGGGLEDWSRLIRAYSVLHETDKAKAALAEARKALAADASAGASLDSLAKDLSIGD